MDTGSVARGRYWSENKLVRKYGEVEVRGKRERGRKKEREKKKR